MPAVRYSTFREAVEQAVEPLPFVVDVVGTWHNAVIFY
jgi:hypothetical protein